MKADEVAFYYVEPRGALWPCTVYAVTNNDGDLLPALNVIPLETSDEMAPPPPPVPPQEQYLPPNPDLKQDVIQMMGPTVGQLEHHVVDDSSDTGAAGRRCPYSGTTHTGRHSITSTSRGPISARHY